MSSIFDLDPGGKRQLDEDAQLNPLDLSQAKNTAFSGTGQAFKGLLQVPAQTGRTLLTVGGLAPIGYDAARGLFAGNNDHAAGDWYFKHAVDDLGTNAVDHWTPDASTMGSAAKAVNATSTVVGSLPVLFAAPEVFLGNAAFSPATDLTRQGVDSATALGVGGISLGVNAIGLKLPAAFGSTLATRLTTGAGENLALGIGSDVASAKVLQAGGYTEQAKGYDYTDPHKRMLDTLMGIAFGGAAHLGARVSPAERDAVLTARNAQHFQDTTAPGVPVDAAAAVAHQDALAKAIQQALNGEPVDIAGMIRPEDFVARSSAPVSAETGGAHDYASFRHALESGGNPEAANPRSSALGIDQFTASTWLSTVKQAAPAWAEGKTQTELLAMRTDTAKSAEMVAHFDDANGAVLRDAGQPVTSYTLYAAHHFGAGKAVDFARAADDTPMREILSKAQIKANPYLADLTKAQTIANWQQRARRAGINPDGSLVDTNPAGQALRQRFVSDPEQLFRDYAALPDSEGGRVLNTDTARELSPEYLADRTRSADVHEAASDTIKALYEKKLAEPTPDGFDRSVLFTAGGTGAGKTTAVRALEGVDRPPELVYDTNMNTLASAQQKIEQALAAGRDVQILYVYRDPVEALTGGALPRAERQAKEFGSGRTVPLSEHAKTHTGVRPVMEALAEKYKNDPRVDIRAYDNSRGQGAGQFADLADIPRIDQNGLHERLQAAIEAEHQAGRISDATRAGFDNPGRDAQGVQRQPVQGAGREPQPQSGQGEQPSQGLSDTTLQAAQRMAAESPDLHVIDGFDADGSPVYRPMADALAEIETQRQQAAVEAQAFPAAVACAIRRGP